MLLSLRLRLDRVVLDRTGLSGVYDIDIVLPRPPGERWGTDTNGDPMSPGDYVKEHVVHVDSSLREQLGLRLEKSKGPVEVLAVQHVRELREN